jgi:putative membrane protein
MNSGKGWSIMMGYYGYGGMGWIGMIVGLVITIAVIIGLVLLVVWAVRRMNGNSAQPGSQNQAGQSARDIAQARYARGEINREEYQQVLSDLGR